MKGKQKTKVEAEMIEFVIRCSDNEIWISIESMVVNKIIENAFKAELRKKEVSKICSNICEELNSIFDIRNNKRSLMNIINATSMSERKLSLMTLSLASYREFDVFGNEIKVEPQILIEPNRTQLPYLEINNEFSKLVNYIYDNKKKLINFASILYWASTDAYYDYRSRLESEVSY
ncbi:hypothetical protein [Clostridium sp. D53t1_180928_C8]|uniref:hypothetical protein n=1 Tax=Clostridium sp. D53t1_180928_C8 TaxID=2787101 RepID=UPI0018AA1A53|nr:hypothetical protein [Clostridium sp. D53t1_180928_C8]